MNEHPPLHGSIVALVSLASSIAANHPKMGLCQLERLKDMGVADHQIDSVIEIARHIRDEAAGLLDRQFDEQRDPPKTKTLQANSVFEISSGTGDDCGCGTTPGGQSCC